MNRFIVGLLLMGLSHLIYAQQPNFKYQREIKDVKQNWSKISIPNDLYKKLNPDFSDIRIYSFNDLDTIEVPYLLKIKDEEQSLESVSYTSLNESHDLANYFYTFQIEQHVPINEIKLNFNLANFDWLVQWQGSNDLLKWYNILDDYRILSIVNGTTDYQHTQLTFPTSQYKYYRLQIPSVVNPQFSNAEISLKKTQPAHFKPFKIQSWQVTLDKPNKETHLVVTLDEWVPVSYIKVFAHNEIAYSRNILIENQSDSIKTKEGWKPFYYYLSGGILNSSTSNEFTFDGKLLKSFRITIQNKDNQPLQIDSIEVKGFEHEIWARFPDLKKNYILTYGNQNQMSPDYDLLNHPNEIPENVPAVALGTEKFRNTQHLSNSQALFKNPLTLWIILGLGIALLGGFSYLMLKNKP